MKNFKDSATGEIYNFDDSVIEDNSSGNYVFKTPAGLTIPTPTTLQPYTPPAPTAAELLATAQAAQVGIIQASALATETSPLHFTTAANVSGYFPMDARAQIKYLGAYTRYVVHAQTLPSSFAFYDSTGTAIAFTVADIDNFATAGFLQVEASLAKESSLISQIASASTVSAVQAVVW